MIVHSPSYTAAKSCAIDLDGVPQIPSEIAEKLSHVERYKEVSLTSSDYKRIRIAINAACLEIRRRRWELERQQEDAIAAAIEVTEELNEYGYR